MSLRAMSCVELICDICEEALGDDDGARVHEESTQELVEMARRWGWTVQGDRAVCGAEDEDHDKARAEMTAPETVVTLTLHGGERDGGEQRG